MPNIKSLNKSFDFGKDKKLLGKNEYSSVFAGRKTIYGKYFQIIYQQTENYSKLGLAIAKKHHKLATQRNALKRIVREFFRLNCISGFNIVVLSKVINKKNGLNLNGKLNPSYDKKNNKFFNKNNNNVFFADLENLFTTLKKIKK